MMKATNRFLLLAITALLFTSVGFAQEEEEKVPKYITVTTLHWNMDYDNFDMNTWKDVEKEFFDKVTMKNEHIMGTGVYTHRYTPDNRELILVSVYDSWEAIDKAADRNSELIKEAWPDEDARDAYFDKRNEYYSDFHSDEIYATMPHAKPRAATDTTSNILFVRRSQFKFPRDGSQEEFMASFKEYVENVFHKNELIKGYYPNAHFWGSDRREFAEAFYVDSMQDLDDMFTRNNELFAEHWSDDEGKKKMQEMANKYFTGVHGDYVYTVIPELRK
ncbi:hypothetical protein [Flagellimonas sp.]|uniref:hypothetical protein n=1 Tax=Flagellimonas sp. TaxID=2058762 RepID=UPI003BAE48A9